jgi:hypothetical protein
MSRFALLTLAAAFGALSLGGVAHGQSITLGQAASDPLAACGADGVGFNTATRPGGPSYVVPAGVWTISSFSFAGGTGGSLAPMVVRPTGVLDEYIVVYAGAAQTLTAGVINAFPASVTVQGGDIIGLWGAMGTECGVPTGDPADVVAFFFVAAPPPAGTTFTAPPIATAFNANVAAALSSGSSSSPEPPRPAPRVGVCTGRAFVRGDGTFGTFADILLSQQGTKDESSPYFGAVPAIYVQGYGLVCRISDITAYGGDPSKFRDAGVKVDGTGTQPPRGLEALWWAPYEYWIKSGP